MDEKTEQAQEAALVEELLHNERIIDHPTFGQVRIKRPTPGQERLIAEIRRKQYQQDLFSDDVKSKDEIEKRAIERGMWTTDMTQRIEGLTLKLGEAMAMLDAIGFQSLEELLAKYNKCVADLRELYTDNVDIQDAVRVYFDLDQRPTAEGRAKIVDAAPSTSVDDLMEEGEQLRVQVELLSEMGKVRKELQELQAKQTRLFVDSVESRADRAQELATVYYCTSHAESGQRLWPRFEDIYNAPAEDIEILIWQMHYFNNGILPEFQERLAKYGFMPRLTGTKASSDDSLDQPQSNSDGESVDIAPTSSSPATA